MKKIDYLKTLFVETDIAYRINVVSSIDFNQNYFIKMKPVPNSQEGAVLLEAMIVDVLDNNHQFKYVIIGMESTGFYGVPIANYLSASDKLAPFSIHVYCINSKEVKTIKNPLMILVKMMVLILLLSLIMHITECIAKVYFAGILAELGSIKAFQNSDALAKL